VFFDFQFTREQAPQRVTLIDGKCANDPREFETASSFFSCLPTASFQAPFKCQLKLNRLSLRKNTGKVWWPCDLPF